MAEEKGRLHVLSGFEHKLLTLLNVGIVLPCCHIMWRLLLEVKLLIGESNDDVGTVLGGVGHSVSTVRRGRVRPDGGK